MTIAELHGKISRTGINLHDQLEDLLTSDVFTACKYVRPRSLLLPFLSTARSLRRKSLAQTIPSAVAAAQYKFWPLHRHSEPDLLIRLQLQTGKSILILIEAKYLSLKSGAALEAEQLEIARAPADQLAREYLDLLAAHRTFHQPESQIDSRYLLYITAHRLMPESELRESLREISYFNPGGPEPDIYWTNWFNLHPLLKRTKDLLDWERPILKDLRLLLERKRLIHFQGFSRLHKLSLIEPAGIYRTATKPRS